MQTTKYYFVEEEPSSSQKTRRLKHFACHAQLFTLARRRQKFAPGNAPRSWLVSESKTLTGEQRISQPGLSGEEVEANEELLDSHPPLLANAHPEPIATIESPPLLDSQDSPFSLAIMKACHAAPQPSHPSDNLPPWTYVIFDYFTRCWTLMPSGTGTPLPVRSTLLHDAVADRIQYCVANETHLYSLAAAVALTHAFRDTYLSV